MLKNEAKTPKSKKTTADFNYKNTIKPGYRNLIIGFAVLAIILVMAILYFALSQATVIVTPTFQYQKTEFAVQIVDQNFVDPNNLTPGRLLGEIKETLVEATQEFSASGYEVTDEKAGGSITIINNHSASQPLIATTRFLTSDGKLYRLVSGVTIPAGGRVTAQVLADQTGAEFEIGPSKLTIPGLWEGLQDKIYAETEGFTRQTYTKYQITQEDIDKASDSLINQLLDQAVNELSQDLTGNQTISTNDLVAETIKFSVSQEAGAEAENFSVTLGLGVKAIIFDQEQLKQVAFNSLPDAYKQKNTFVRINYDSLNYQITLFEENSENLIAQAKGSFNTAVASLNINKDALKGLSKKEAEQYLAGLGNIDQVLIRLPFWTNYLPNLTDHIDLQIKQ